MKKTFLLLVSAALVVAGCDNENTVNPQPTGLVSISGTIYSDLDENDPAGDPIYESVPADVAVYFYDSNTGALLGASETDGSGKYEIELEIGVRSRDIEIVVGDFETTIKVYDFVNDVYVSKNAVYAEREGASINDAVKDASYIQNIEIDQPEVINFD